MKVMLSTGNDKWGTDPADFIVLNEIFKFTIDVCATAKSAKVETYWTEDDDCLKKDWRGRVCFMNPPYSAAEKKCKPICTKKRCPKRGYHLLKDNPGQAAFIKKAYAEALAGAIVVCYIPSRTESIPWHSCVLQGDTFMHYKGRRKMENAKDPAPFPTTVAVFTPWMDVCSDRADLLLNLEELENRYTNIHLDLVNWRNDGGSPA